MTELQLETGQEVPRQKSRESLLGPHQETKEEETNIEIEREQKGHISNGNGTSRRIGIADRTGERIEFE